MTERTRRVADGFFVTTLGQEKALISAEAFLHCVFDRTPALASADRRGSSSSHKWLQIGLVRREKQLVNGTLIVWRQGAGARLLPKPKGDRQRIDIDIGRKARISEAHGWIWRRSLDNCIEKIEHFGFVLPGIQL